MGKSMIFFAVLAITIMLSIMVFAQDMNSTQNKNISGAHTDSEKVTSAFPDKCNTPSAPVAIPIPYPNTAMSLDMNKGSKKVKMDDSPVIPKHSNFSESMGDENGTGNRVSPQHKRHRGYFMQMRQQRSPASSSQQMRPGNPEHMMQPEEPLQQTMPGAPMKNWIEMELKDEVMKQVPSERFEITLPDGKGRKGSIDSQGKAKGGGITPGTISISFPGEKSKKLEKQE